ncbi:MAG TPA: DUF4350 domain-containing protein [Thermoguttaceae bacterium]|nr:DUF4350 domain-containing protein [Thermoguttaceae bacterium]
MNLRAWAAVGLFSASWLPALGYYGPANVWAWAAMIVLGAVLLRDWEIALPEATIALALLLPVVWFMPWPAKAAAIFLAVGLAAVVVPIPRGWPRRVAPACIVSGGVLLAQSAAVYVYMVVTSRSHDLPGPLALLVGEVARLAGADVVVTGSTLAARGATAVHPLGATWDLLLPPTVVCFVVGAAFLLALNMAGLARRKRSWLRAVWLLALVTALWLPIQLVFVLGLYFNRVALVDPEYPPCVMNQWLVWWLPAVLLAGPVLLAWWFVSCKDSQGAKDDDSQKQAADELTGRRCWTAVALAALGAALLAFPWAWDPIGGAKEGRVRVVERGSRWEPTDAPYDENSFGEPASYTYRLIYDYASHFFTMSRIGRETPISAESLDGCDVLVLKTPTSRMSPDEVKAILQFVERGGGLLLIGDHTNVFRSSTYLNDVARPLGFTFRNDLLFRVGTPYEQPFRPAAVAHPAVIHVDNVDLAISCSIDPGWSWGRSAVTGSGLWSLQAEYQNENYHPPAEYRAEMRTGPFVQLWAARHGEGRVLAFTDSTIFSNFCVFQPGKAELMLNMFAWLNHGSSLDERLNWLMVVVPVGLVGLTLFGLGWMVGRKSRGGGLLVLSAALFGCVACSMIVGALAAMGMPAPSPHHPPLRVVIDRTVSDVPLSEGAFTHRSGLGYGLLEQWIPRVGRPKDPNAAPTNPLPYTMRRRGAEAFSGDVLVVICPTGSVGRDYRERLVRFVREGGRLLVLDSFDNTHSTANRLLWPFGLSMEDGPARKGPLSVLGTSTSVEVQQARAVEGGAPIAELVQTSSAQAPGGTARATVAAEVSFGKGKVMAVGCASTWNDAAMGDWSIEPDGAERRRYNAFFSLMRHMLRDSRRD